MSASTAAARQVPGAPPSLTASSKGRKKSSHKLKQTGNGSVNSTTEAALLESLPNPSSQVQADILQVHAEDRSEQAERQAALAISGLMGAQAQPATEAGMDLASSSRLTASGLVNKRLKVIGKKIQRASQYESEPPESLNADQKRIIATKPSLLAVQIELQEILNALSSVEREEAVLARAEAEQHAASAAALAKKEASEQTVALLQFLHLFALFHPHILTGVNSFTQDASLPKDLEEGSTSQEVAALACLFEQLALGPLEASTAARVAGQADGALDIVRKLRDVREHGDVLSGVGYPRVREMIHQLISPPQARDKHNAQDSQSDENESVDSDEIVVTGQGAHAGKVLGLAFGSIMVETERKSGDPGLVFMQDSELDGPEGDVPAAASIVGQEDPVVAQENPDHLGLSQSVEQSHAIAEGGTAPVEQKTDASSTTPKPFETQPADVESSFDAPLSWADEPMAPPTAALKAAPAMPTNAASSATSAKKGPATGKDRQKRADQPDTRADQAKKAQPLVDEDGFTLLTSKRSQMLEKTRGGARGRGRIGYAGRAAARNLQGSPSPRDGDKQQDQASFAGRDRNEGPSDSRGTSTRGRGRGSAGKESSGS